MSFVERNWWERDVKLNMKDPPLYTFNQFLEKDFKRRYGTFTVSHNGLESVVGEGGGGFEGVDSLLKRSNSPSLKVLPCSVVINVKCLRVISHMDRAYILVDERKSLKVVDDSFSSERKSLKAIDIFRQALIDKQKSADSDEQSSLFPVQVVQAVVDTVLERCETKYEALYDFFKPFTCLRQREKSVNEVRTMEKISQKLESLENLLSKVKAMIGMLRKNRDLASCEEGRTMLKVITVDFEVQLNRFLTFEEKTEKLLRFATKLNDAMEHSNRARQAVLGTETLKFLQIPGLAFIVPTLIAGVLGMNLNTSFADSKDAFYITVLLFLVIAAWVAMFQLFQKKRLA